MSKTFTTILVPVDFSPSAREALLYAGSIAERFSATIVVMHVIAKEVELSTTYKRAGYRSVPLLGPFTETLDMPTDVTEAVVIDLREQARAALQQFLPLELRGQQVRLHVAVGTPFEQILRTATQNNVDLIVMGTHGRTGLARVMLGSVAERVVRLAPCPVLAVKAAATGTEQESSRVAR